ncbi:MAG: hypothetical protein V3V29_00190 [Acidimicrobiia bacterium]
MKHTLKIGITALVVAALAMSGIALAQTDETNDEVAVQDTVAYAKIVEKLQPLVDDGTLTDAQAEAVAEALAEGMRPGFRRGHRGPNFGAIAEYLGLEGEKFREALQEYDTLADLAAANGSSGTELIGFLVDHVEERLDQAVVDGKIEQADADEKLAEAEEKITEMVNSEIPEPGRRRPGSGGFGGSPPADGLGTSA